VIERKLKINLTDAIELLQGTIWKFFEVLDQEWIRIEFKRDGELNVIEIPNQSGVVNKLKKEGFIQQTKRRVFG